jgi:hypothetical protein
MIIFDDGFRTSLLELFTWRRDVRRFRPAIWGGLISPLLILYATTHQIGLSGPILVTTVVGLAIFLVAVLLSPETKGKVLIADLTVA